MGIVTVYLSQRDVVRVRRVNRRRVEHVVPGDQGAPGSVEAMCVVRTGDAHPGTTSAEEWAAEAEEGVPA